MTKRKQQTSSTAPSSAGLPPGKAVFPKRAKVEEVAQPSSPESPKAVPGHIAAGDIDDIFKQVRAKKQSTAKPDKVPIQLWVASCHQRAKLNSHSVCRRSRLPLSLQHFREAKMISLALVSPSSAGVLLTMLDYLQLSRVSDWASQGQPCLSCCRFDAEGLPVYTADELNVGVGGDTDQCPFDCTCCF